VHAQIPPARLPVESAQVGERLLQLASQISREVDGMLKQLVTLQLHNADNGPDQQQRWLLELPVQSSAGLLTLDTEIDHQQEPGDGEEDHWSMQLRLDLPKLGPLLIQLSLREGRLHANLIAEQSAGAQMLQSHLQELRTQLEHRDLNIASLHARSGPTGRPPKARAPLLNERA
jgi:flagellar hook-length control protein FliK